MDGKIIAIGPELGHAERAIDATGLVVVPGFIDLHAHGQSIPADRMQAFDGVTTTLDLKAGVLPVASLYRRQADQGRVLNFASEFGWLLHPLYPSVGERAAGAVAVGRHAQMHARERRFWRGKAARQQHVALYSDHDEPARQPPSAAVPPST